MNYIKIFIIFFVVFYLKVTVDSSRDWWKYTTIYEIYIWSFKDSNGDGIGDIKGNKSEENSILCSKCIKLSILMLE